MTSKSSSSENKAEKRNGAVSFRKLIAQNIQGNLWLVLLALLVMLFNYPVNLAAQLTSLQQEYERQGYSVETAVMAGAANSGTSAEAAGVASVIGGADGPTSIFIAEKSAQLSEKMTDAANRMLLGGNSSLIAFITAAAAALCAFAMFRYLYSRPQVDFYHSLPVSRTRRFFAHYISGALIMAGSYAVGLLGAVLTAAVFQVQDLMLGQMLLANAGFFLIFLLIYTATAGTMLLCGNLAVGVLASGWLWSAGPAAAGIIYTLKSAHFDTLYNAAGAEQRLQYLSPIKYLIEYTEYTFWLGSAGNAPSARELARLSALWPHTEKVLLLAAALTAAGILTTLFLYQRRASEAAGSAIAFRSVKAPVRVITTVLAALLLSLLGTALENLAWTIFFTLITAVIVHALLEVIIQLDIRKLLAHRAELLLSAVLSLLIVLSFQFDVLGYNRYIPEASAVESASFYTSLFTDGIMSEAVTNAEREYGSLADGTFAAEGESGGGYGSYEQAADRMQLRDPAAIEAVHRLSERGVAELDEAGGQSRYAYDGTERYYVRIKYRLKNGRTDDRDYYLPAGDILEAAAPIFALSDYKKANYPVLGVSPENAGAFGIVLSDAEKKENTTAAGALSVLPASLSNYFSGAEKLGAPLDLSGLSPKIDEALLSALQKDLSALSLEDYDQNWTGELNGDEKARHYSYLVYVPKEEVLAEEIRAEEARAANWEVRGDRDRYWYFDVYPILESFQNVRAVLSEYGISLQQ